MLRRFVFRFLIFIALIFPGSFLAALATAQASPAQVESSGCERTLADTTANLAAMQARVKSLSSKRAPDTCSVTRLYFLELVKARAATAMCKSGADRDRELGRFDADVEQINETIAAQCG